MKKGADSRGIDAFNSLMNNALHCLVIRPFLVGPATLAMRQKAPPWKILPSSYGGIVDRYRKAAPPSRFARHQDDCGSGAVILMRASASGGPAFLPPFTPSLEDALWNHHMHADRSVDELRDRHIPGNTQQLVRI